MTEETYGMAYWGRHLHLFPPATAYMRQWTGSAMVQVMACHLYGVKP